jgi:uncharacterized protein (TIGR02246 family)
MKKQNYFRIATAGVVVCLFAISCSSPATVDEKAATTQATAPVEQVAAKPDMAKIKAEIQALETSWAAADNARDTNAIAAFYADDAVSLASNKPMLVGNAAIKEDIKQSMAKRAKGATLAYNVLDVFGDENQVTEVGTTTVKDASGKVTYTGKYMAVWEKRNGKYICIRDIGNDDKKEK